MQSSASLTVNQLSLHGHQIRQLNVTGHLQYINEQLRSNWTLAFDQRASLIANIVLPRFSGLSDFHQAVQGAIQLTQTPIVRLGIDLPEVKNVAGTLSGSINLRGTLANPMFSGGLILANGSASIPTLGIRLHQLMLRAQFDTTNQVMLNGQFRLGGGSANLNGRIRFQPTLLGDMTIQGNNLQVVNTKEYKVTASPNLKIDYSPRAILLTGNIHIPSADINPTPYINVVTLPDDVVFVGQEKPFNLQRYLTIQVRLTLGNAIHIRYEDLTTYVNGALAISSIPPNDPTAKGALMLERGTYKAYGKELIIQQGRIIYNGNILTNPNLDIRAVKQIRTIAMAGNQTSGLTSAYLGAEEVSVGVTVKGTINNPIVRLYSSPGGMSQGDILSYLLFGYSQSELQGGNKLALLNAASLLNLPQSDLTSGVSQGLQNIVGLTEFNLGSTEVYNPETNTVSNETTVNVGKQIANRLSIHYSVGVFSSLAVLRILYQLTPNFAIQSETSAFESAGDILYSYERE